MFLTTILYMLMLGLIINHGLQFLQMKMTMRRMTMMNKRDKLTNMWDHHPHQLTSSHHQLSLDHHALLLPLIRMAPFHQLVSTPEFLNPSAMARIQKLMFLHSRTKLLCCARRMKNLWHMLLAYNHVQALKHCLNAKVPGLKRMVCCCTSI